MISYFRARFVSPYYENVLSIKASSILQLTENTVPSRSFHGVTVMYGRYQLTSYEKLLILLRILVYRKYVQPSVLMCLLSHLFVTSHQTRWAPNCESHFHLFCLTLEQRRIVS